MTKIILSLLTIVLAAGVAIGASGAWFRDTETSVGNTFTAGIIDLEIDCNGDTIFEAQDEKPLDADPQNRSLPLIFDYLPVGPKDIKPGFSGEVTLSLHLKQDSNNADLWMDILNLANFGGANPDREQEVEAVNGVDDDFSDHILTKVWLDEGSTAGWQNKPNEPIIDPEEGNNIYDKDNDGIGIEPVYYDGNMTGLEAQGNFTIKQNAVACTTYYVGWSWSLPTTVGNEHQGDYCTFDIVFGADQVTTYNVATFVVPGGGSVILDPSGGTYDAGTTVTVTASADPGFRFNFWSGDLSGDTNPETLVVDSDKSVTANFIARYTLTTSASPTEGGSVSGAGTYDDGTPVQVEATPTDSCWYFVKWSGDLSGSTNPDTITIDGNKNVTATFAKYQYTLNKTVVGTGNITLTPPGGTYDCGTVVSVAASTNDDPCWHFTGWSQDLSGTVTPQNITMNGDKNVTATFEKYQYDLTVNAGTGGTTDPSGTASHECGSDVLVYAYPASCYQFTGWTGNVPSGHQNDNPVTIHMDGTKTINATFAKISYDLTVNAGTGGTTSPSGTASHECGSDVLVYAYPSDCYQFTGWTGNVPSGHENDNPVSIHMDGAKTINATFAKISYDLTVNAGTGGTTSPSGTASHECGSDVLVYAYPSDCYQFTGWTGNVPSGHENDNPVSIHMDGAKTINATFAKINYDLTVNAGTGGTTSPSGTTSRECGSDILVYAYPDSCYQFTGWTGNVPSGHENDNPVTIHMDGAKTINATFAKYQYTLTTSVDPVGSGTVDLTPPGGTYNCGTVVTVYGNATSGYEFDYWTGNLTGSVNPQNLTMNANKSVTAHFKTTVQPTQTTLDALKDSYINSSSTGSNYGNSDSMQVRHTSDRWGLIAFDLSSIPSGAIIDSAELKLYCDTNYNNDPPATVYAYAITSAWTETGVTWATQPGAASGSTDSESATAGNWVTWTVTSDVQSFVNNPCTNNGWMLKVFDTNKGAYFRTKEYTGTTYDPDLVITYHTTQPALTFGASKDSYIDRSNSSSNYGAQQYMYTGNSTSDRYRSVVAFNLTSIPSTAVIDSATLRVYCYNASSPNPTVGAYRITDTWTETGVNWSNTNGDYFSPATASTTASTGSWTEWTVTSDVQAFIDGTANNGWMLITTPSSSRWAQFRTKEYCATDPSKCPQLVVTYHIPPMVTLSASQDSYVNEGSTTTNYNSDNFLRVGQYYNRRGLVQFDLSSLAGKTIDSAELSLYCYDNDNWDGSSVSAYRITGTWAEGTVTWSTRPAPTSPSSATDTQTVPSSNGWVTWNVTSDVQAFISGTANNGWYLKKTSESTPAMSVYFYSSEYTGDTTLCPKLVVTYH